MEKIDTNKAYFTVFFQFATLTRLIPLLLQAFTFNTSRCPHFFLCLVLLSIFIYLSHFSRFAVGTRRLTWRFSFTASQDEQNDMQTCYLGFTKNYFPTRYYHSPYKMENAFPLNSAAKNHNSGDIFLLAKLTSNSAFGWVKIKHVIGQWFWLKVYALMIGLHNVFLSFRQCNTVFVSILMSIRNGNTKAGFFT